MDSNNYLDFPLLGTCVYDSFCIGTDKYVYNIVIKYLKIFNLYMVCHNLC